MLMLLVCSPEGVSLAAGAETGKPADPIWTREVKIPDKPPQRVLILGTRDNGKFTPTSVLPPEPPMPATTVSFPLQADLVPTLTFRSFGEEERTRVSRVGDALRIRCRTGRKPAGVLLSLAGFHFPRGLHGQMTIEGRSSGRFQISFAEAGKEAESFVPLSSGGAREFRSNVPASLWASLDSPGDLVIACPRGAGNLALARITIEPAARTVRQPQGTWIWDVGKWLGRGDQLISELNRRHIGEVFIQVQIAKGEIVERQALVTLIKALAAAGIRVNTVEGDGTMASPKGRSVALERARLLAGLKSEMDGKLLSFQYDIEPYVVPEFASDPDFWWNGWGTTIADLATTVKEPVSAVVPFWLLKYPVAENALRRVRKSVSRIVVMSYRTQAGAVEEIAEDWLDWGRRNGVPVAFALENGLVPTEYQQTYLRAETGQVVLEVSGQAGRVQLYAEPVLGTGRRLAYSFGFETKIDSARISFLGDHARLKEVRDRVQANLSAWDSFDGLLVHEIVK
jgi:hypothetical protein